MRIFLIVSVSAMLLCLSTIAYSADGLYISNNVGLVIATDSDVTDPDFLPEINKIILESASGFVLTGALGYTGGPLRGEVEIGYQKNNLDQGKREGPVCPCPVQPLSGDITSLSVLVNGYYDFNTASPITPFVSVGLGVARVEVDNTVLGNHNDSVFAYQVGGGVGYAVDEQVSVDIKYRYFATSNLEFDNASAEYSNHNFSIGLRTSF